VRTRGITVVLLASFAWLEAALASEILRLGYGLRYGLYFRGNAIFSGVKYTRVRSARYKIMITMREMLVLNIMQLPPFSEHCDCQSTDLSCRNGVTT
jgi:hypothetical protein